MRLAPTVYHELPPATKYALALMAAGYGISLIFGYRADLLLGLVPAFAVGRLWLWQFITYLFLHGGFWHLAFNAFMMWMFGEMFERFWGTKKFIRYCVITGVGAALFHIAASPHSLVPVIGISGVIFGLLAAFALEFPETTVYVWFIFPMKAVYMALLLGAAELAASFRPGQSAVANLAHLGGMATGYVYLRWYPAIVEKFESLIPQRQEQPRPARTRADSEIDIILDKISRKGINSLDEAEKRVMDRYSKWVKK